MSESDFIPPHSIEAEMAMLGSMLLSERACGELGWVKREMLYQPAHKMVFDALVWLYVQSRQIDLVTVKDRLKEQGLLQEIGGTEYLVQIAESVPTAQNAQHYADIVRDKWVLRELESRLDSCLKNARNPDESVGQKVETAMRIPNGLLDYSTYEFNVAEFAQHLSDKTLPGLPAGILAIDRQSGAGGLYRDEPNLVSAMTGVGKTNIALNLVKKWCMEGKRGFFVSVELKAEKVIRRLMKMLSGYWSLDQARSMGDEKAWNNALSEIAGWDLTIYDPSKTRGGSKDVESICEWIVAKNERQQFDFGVVDYVQLLKTRQKTSGKTQVMEIVEDELRALNARCGFVLVLLAQLIRTRDKNGKPFYEIRNSREFGNGCAYDLRLIEDDGHLCISCEKNRDGKGYWTHQVSFDPAYLTFSSHPLEAMR